MHVLSHPQIVGRLQRGAALAADDGGTIAAGKGIGSFLRALRAIERGCWLLRVRLRAWSHVESQCSIRMTSKALFRTDPI